MREWKFITELRTFPERIPLYGERLERPCIVAGFPDPDRLLQSAYNALSRLHCGKISVRTEADPALTGEDHQIRLAPGTAVITAGTTEGIRRGIYFLCDFLLHTPPEKLPEKTIFRRCWLKRRIGRCFFGPIKRPPMNRDELLDDVDYYPEGYLDRLAAEGVNVLWLTVSLRDLCRTRFTPDAAPDREKRFAKLNRTIQKCAKYGIRIYLFTNEPEAWQTPPKEPSLAGPLLYGRSCFCPCSEAGKEYLRESMHQIFSNAPGLGGLINITIGEGLTTCLSSHTRDGIPCPHRCGHAESEILRMELEAMRDGMKSVAPDAELVAWFYLPEPKRTPAWIESAFEGIPDDVIPQMNGESGIQTIQQGKLRTGGDYWQCRDNFSENFLRFAKGRKHPFSVKLQTGCSHEIATVPYVPVPSTLYRKFRVLKELGVASAMTGWYFGHACGLMNRAVERLSFTEFSECSEDQFLQDLALRDWGMEKAGTVCRIWKQFAGAYSEYPLSNMFQYYGPIACGVRWPLYPEPAEKRLLPTWILSPDQPGDTLRELTMDFGMEDLLAQTSQMSEKWHPAAEELSQIAETRVQRLEANLCRAIGIQFQSAAAILSYYQARAEGRTKEMEQIQKEEFSRREQMIRLCRQDPRLGFHPEAEGYLYDADLIRESMKTPELQSAPLRFREPETFSWDCHFEDDVFCVEAVCRGYEKPLDEFYIGMDNGKCVFPWLFHGDCTGRIFTIPNGSSGTITPEADQWTVSCRIPVSLLPGGSRQGLRLNLIRLRGNYENRDSWPPERSRISPRLNLIFYNSANMAEISDFREL